MHKFSFLEMLHRLKCFTFFAERGPGFIVRDPAVHARHRLIKRAALIEPIFFFIVSMLHKYPGLDQKLFQYR